MEDAFSLSGVKVAMTPMARFEEFLRSRGKRVTQQRRAILELSMNMITVIPNTITYTAKLAINSLNFKATRFRQSEIMSRGSATSE
jgi:hypothetical protein